jgi:hypothetical protein
LLYFLHSGGLGKLYARLGLFRDSATLKGNDFHRAGRRKWRTSYILPFSANLIFAHYKCPSGIVTKTYVNGQEINPQLFNSTGFLDALQPMADDCDFDNMCALPEKPQKPITTILTIKPFVSTTPNPTSENPFKMLDRSMITMDEIN